MEHQLHIAKATFDGIVQFASARRLTNEPSADSSRANEDLFEALKALSQEELADVSALFIIGDGMENDLESARKVSRRQGSNAVEILHSAEHLDQTLVSGLIKLRDVNRVEWKAAEAIA